MTEIAGASLERLIQEALAEERKLKSSFEQRAAFVISSSGGLTALLFAFSAIATGSGSFELPLLVKVLLVVAVVLFVASGLLCLKVKQPTDYEEASIAGLQRLVADERVWKADQVVGLRTASLNRVQILARFRCANAKKGEYLRWAIGAQVAALIGVALGVIAILLMPSS